MMDVLLLESSSGIILVDDKFQSYQKNNILDKKLQLSLRICESESFGLTVTHLFPRIYGNVNNRELILQVQSPFSTITHYIFIVCYCSFAAHL